MTSRRFLRDIFPVLLWLGVIFFLSTDNGSANHTNSFLDRALQFISGGAIRLTAAQLDVWHYCVRKAAHMSEYLILAALTVRAIAKSQWGEVRPGRMALLAWGFATFYAMTDEFHQRFVSSRTPKATDVLFDSFGALLGVGVAFGITYYRRTRRTRSAETRVARPQSLNETS
ncbi:MAG: VanZ family protein [Capsulimonas sp.]|uniref:VanZ family protein n=1 Tax=Capsulimonas sp. TaxID=2494211 RepID=UPI0032651DC1